MVSLLACMSFVVQGVHALTLAPFSFGWFESFACCYVLYTWFVHVNKLKLRMILCVVLTFSVHASTFPIWHSGTNLPVHAALLPAVMPALSKTYNSASWMSGFSGIAAAIGKSVQMARYIADERCDFCMFSHCGNILCILYLDDRRLPEFFTVIQNRRCAPQCQ